MSKSKVRANNAQAAVATAAADNKEQAAAQQAAPAAAAKKEKPEGRVTFVSLLDVILKKGGTWKEMIEAGNAAKAKLEAENPEIPVKFTGKGKLMSLIHYRVDVQKQENYLEGKKVTPEGIF